MTSGYDDNMAAMTFEHDDDSVVVIVGVGGGTLASELAQKGIDVVALEAGPRLEMTDFVNDELGAFEQLSWLDPRTCSGDATFVHNAPTFPTWICKTVGGSTVHWVGNSPRLQPREFRPCTEYGDVAGANLIDWPIALEEMLPYYERAEDKMGVTGRHGIPHLPNGSPLSNGDCGSRVALGHPEGYQEAFANLYVDAAAAIVARCMGETVDPLALDFPTVEDGALGMKFIQACVDSQNAGGAWPDCTLDP